MSGASPPSLAELQRTFAAGRMTALGRAERLARAHEAAGRALGAYRAFDPERLRGQARALDEARRAGAPAGPLAAVPVSVKDLYGVGGMQTFAGSPRPLPERFGRDGWLVRRVRRAGALLTGKTHTVEFAFGGLGTNPHWPTPRNPWDAADHRVPGGSSSGAGVSLHDGTARLALGTDTAGSVRIPAAWTGVAGLKTTAGRWPTDGIVPLSPTLDTAGLLAATVEDVAWAFGALDPAWGDPEVFLAAWPARPVAGLRLGLLADPWMVDCRDGVDEVVGETLRELERAGATVREVALPEAAEALALFGQGGPVAAELTEFLASELPGWRDTLDPNVAARLDRAEQLPAVEYLRRRRALRRLARRAAAAFAELEVDLLVGPTVALGPPTLRAVADPGAYREANLLALRNTAVVSYLGLSALSLPAGRDDSGMPVGLHLVAPPRREETLLSAALGIEATLGSGPQRLGRPPLGAAGC